MKIGIIIQKLNFGGAERCASNLSIDFEEKFDTHLIVFDGENQMYPHGGVLHDLKSQPTHNKIKKILNAISRINKVKRIKKKEKFDCVISLLTGANYVNVMSTCGERTIVSIRNNLSNSGLSSAEKNMVIKSGKLADCVVCLSESVRQDMIHNFGVDEKKAVTIYNSVDAKRLQKLADETSDENSIAINGDYIVTMGRLMYQKGQWHLIRAFSEIHKKFPDLKLVILGEGEDEFSENIKHLVKKMGLEEVILFPGYIKNPHKIIRDSLMFVFPSLYEGLGNVLLEALACGKAVISTDCLSGPREILAPNTTLQITENKELRDIEYAEYGILVPAFEHKEDFDTVEVIPEEQILANAVCELLGSEKLKSDYELAAKKRVLDFSPEKITADWERIIKMLWVEKHG
ncbi:glycosyltransferase [Enterococcus faecium]|uniref:glycosyltransferase n=1 Tax=Enterococcus faecium TaxID=1352 RepID=UPI0022808047|nr:glycosyltransferase [Enterococcus faecium]MCU1817701.1 glycosyltransferase [Enterococcus faecium]MCY7002399.1 glycosyltransferase [Enterococcus faecium]HAP8953297.1 glycosyltransferase [Enterococcus faecium]